MSVKMLKGEVTIRGCYREYKTRVKNPVEYSLYSEISGLYNKFLIDKMIEGEEVTLPARMGFISIIGTKKKLTYSQSGLPVLPPNWAATKRLWDRDPAAKAERRMVYCLNEATSGVVYKVLWSKRKASVENKSYYNLIMMRVNKRKIHAAIKAGKEYITKEPQQWKRLEE
jgi:hypothetical protein